MSFANLIINSTFKPVTMDDRLKPLLIYQQAYQEQEDALAELESQASVWEKLADSAQDEDVYNQYIAYANSVRNQADSIARQGLTPGSRKAMLDLKARYNRDIDPIQKAWDERDRQYKLQQEMMLKDPTHRFRQSANEIGLRNYMNQQYDALTDNFSGAVLEKQASDAAENLKRIMRDPEELKRMKIPFMYERKIQEGYTAEEINKAIRGDSDADPLLLNIIDSVLESSGVNSWNNKRLTDEARAFAARGLYSALGTSKMETIEDKYGREIALNADRQARDLENYRLKKGIDNPSNGYNPYARIGYWEGTIMNDSNVAEYVDLQKRLTTNGKGLSKDYSSFKDGKFINPLAIYEEVMQYAKDHPHKSTVKNMPIPGASPTAQAISQEIDDSVQHASEVIAKKYGVTRVLSAEDYEKLQGMGYDSSSSFEEMNGTNIADRIDKLGRSYYAATPHLTSYARIEDELNSVTNDAEKKGNFKGLVYESKNGKRGGRVSYKDFKGFGYKEYNDKKSNFKLEGVAYDIREPEYLKIRANGVEYYVHPSIFGDANLSRLIEDAAKEINNNKSNIAKRSYIQADVADQLIDFFNSENKIIGETGK